MAEGASGSVGSDDPGVCLSVLADAFALSPLRVVEHRSGASGVWRLRTAEGVEFALSSRSGSSPSIAGQVGVACELERRAAAVGLDIVPYLRPKHPHVGFAARVGDRLVVLHEWVDARTVQADDVPPAWLGGTVAALHSLWQVNDRTYQRALAHDYGIHSRSSWRHWIEDADRAGHSWASEVEASFDVVEEATNLSESALGLNLPIVRSHRDLNPTNLLHTPTGFRLCDFGYAGPEVSWLEVVDAALACTLEPAATIEEYLMAGGEPGPRRVEALARTTSPMWLARTIAISLGRTGATASRREAATAAVPDILGRMREDLDNLDTAAAMVFPP